MRGVDELAFPDDLDAWRRWAASRQRTRRAAVRARSRIVSLVRKERTTAAPASLLLPADEPDALVVVDVWSPSCQAAVGDPLRYLDPRRTAILTAVPAVVEAYLGGRHRVEFTDPERLPASLHTVISLGAFNDLAGRIESWAHRHDVRYQVVQHGALTPWSPPLTDGSHLLAWSQRDADYWTAGRPSVTAEVVGSQLLWNAMQQPPLDVVDPRPVMLGQLHGTELPARQLQQIYSRFCTAAGAEYRPHPNERDAISRLRHRMMRAAGVQFECSDTPVNELRRPVVSVFSTGTLEAAHRGLPAFVHHPDPPAWLRSFWDRYELRAFGGAPTKPLAQPIIEPARAIAGIRP